MISAARWMQARCSFSFSSHCPGSRSSAREVSPSPRVTAPAGAAVLLRQRR
ncbi:MAG: hypothetical protein U5K31_02515 [Balneolaceae bacterium]|nr:hypothetical protein [Balneolaceae bacterium]